MWGGMSTNQLENNPFYQPMLYMSTKAGVEAQTPFSYQLLNPLHTIIDEELRLYINCLKVN